MRPAPFDYRAVSSAREAAGVLAQAGDETAVLAGGQSLLIDLRYRRMRPRLLLDINGARELEGIRTAGGWARIGALVRHRELEHAISGDPLGRLLGEAARHVAHPPVRVRGTFAGSVAWAHPAAEWCAVTAGLGGEVVLSGSGGERAVPAGSWFAGRHRTARRPGELVTAVRLPLLGNGAGVGFAEHRRTHGSFAMAAAFAAVRVDRGRVSWARIGMANAAEVPVRARDAEAVLAGETLPAGEAVPADRGDAGALLGEAADAAAASADPVSEPHCSAGYRRHVLRVLVRRSLAQALASSPGEGGAAA